jgi:hypothetical protein
MIDEKNQKENARKREIKKDGIWTYIMEINVTYSHTHTRIYIYTYINIYI